jgi:sugar (pentulose or hexulose) kinase
MLAYLTFDIGTTSLKTAITDDGGGLLSVHTAEYTPYAQKAGWAELSAEVYWRTAVEGVRAVLENSRIDPSCISAIGLSSQGQTFIPIDINGKPLRDAIVWVDTRAEKIAKKMERDWLSGDEFRRVTGYPYLYACLTFFKLAWLRENEPRSLNAWKFLCLPDFLIFRMTRELATDYSTAANTGLYNFGVGKWEQSFLNAAGISEGQLPTVLAPGDIAGKISKSAASELGIPPGIPVCVGANDQLVGAVGAGNVEAGIVTETTGTALALVITTDKRIDAKSVSVGRHVIPDRYYAMAFTNTSGIALKWFRDLCGAAADYEEFLKGIDSIPVGCDGLIVIPHFAGSNLPFNPKARGAFVGLTLGHTRNHISRAIMESCAFLLKDCLEPMEKQGVKVNGIRSMGGAAKSDAWLQMKADLLGIPVERTKCSDAASLGAAMIAAAGTGHFTSVSEASREWYKPSKVFDPNKALFSKYTEIYQKYLDISRRLY